MGILRDEAKKLSGSLRQRTAEPELDEEIQFHLDMQTEKNVRLGMSPEEARRAALVRFGGTERIKEEARDEYRSRPLEDFVQDLRYGVRSALGAPLFTLLAVLTLALGIGANAAVFGVVKSVLLDALPYADADRLVRIYAQKLDGTLKRSGVSAGAVGDFTARQRSFTQLAAFFNGTADTTYNSETGPRVLKLALVGGNFFQTLGVAPILGRTLSEADCATGARVTMLSYAAWRRELGGDPDVVGRTLRLNGNPWQVVGVLPRGFVGPMGDADLWLPLDLGPTLRDPIHARRRHWLGLIGRLAPGATVEGAQRDFAAISAGLSRQHPDSDAGLTTTAESLRDAMVGDTRTPLLVLMASAGLVLLITCANLAAAMLSRTLSRRQEFAVRVVARRRAADDSCGKLLTESTMLALAGGVAGILLAVLGLAVIRKLPCRRCHRTRAGDRSRHGARHLPDRAGHRARVRRGAGALRRPHGHPGHAPRGSARRQREPADAAAARRPGGGADRALRQPARRGGAAGPQPVGDGHRAARLRSGRRAGGDHPVRNPQDDDEKLAARFYEELEEHLRALPGVTGVASVERAPGASDEHQRARDRGRHRPAGEGQPFITYASVSDGYFRMLGIPLLRGRTFGPVDRPDTPRAIVISQTMARRYWPKGDAIGARIRLGPDLEGPWSEVVGIVGDVRNDPARPEPEPMSYGVETAGSRASAFLLRTQSDPLALLHPFQGERRRSIRRSRSARRAPCARISPKGWPAAGCRWC